MKVFGSTELNFESKRIRLGHIWCNALGHIWCNGLGHIWCNGLGHIWCNGLGHIWCNGLESRVKLIRVVNVPAEKFIRVKK